MLSRVYAARLLNFFLTFPCPNGILSLEVKELTINDRLKKLRKEKGLTLKQFGKTIGITDASVSQMETGKIGLSNQTIHSICREFGVNENWLRTGEGEMSLSPISQKLEDIYQHHNLTAEDQILMEEFLALRPEVRRGILDYVTRVADRLNKQVDMRFKQNAAELEWQLREEEERVDDSSVLQNTASDTKMA